MKFPFSKALIRLTILIILNTIVRTFDTSESGGFDLSWQTGLLSGLFMTYWYTAWLLAEYIFNRLTMLLKELPIQRRLVSYSLPMLGYGFLVSFLYSIVFRMSDSAVNSDHSTWEGIPFFYGLIVFPFFLLYLLVYLAHLMNYLISYLNRTEIDRAILQRESAMAQYSALKNQIDPHFFFNNLSLLNSLLHENTLLATQFISHLSKLYRYILEVSADRAVMLSEELTRLESYFFLIRIRHGELVRFEVSISPVSLQQVYILPHSLQLLVENAVKHNTFRKEDPLVVEIGEDSECIVVKNNLNKRILLHDSTGMGLENVRRRYLLESRKNIEIIETNSHFVVKLPKLMVHEDSGI